MIGTTMNRDRLTRIILFIIISSIYYATSAGLTSSNDGSHYALLRAMVDEGRFIIESYDDYAEGNDLAIRDGVFYSDRPPGTALVAAPFYVVGSILPRPVTNLPTRHDEGNPRLAYLVMVSALAGAGTVVLVYGLLRHYELSTGMAVTTALAFAFATTNWKYGGVLYSHALSGLLIMGSVSLAIKVAEAHHISWLQGGLLGLMLGLSVLVEYSNAIFVVIILIYLVVMMQARLINKEQWPGLGTLALTGLAALIFLLYYNIVNFGGPFTTSYAYAINYPWATSFSTTFDGPLLKGLGGMLWYGHDLRSEDNQGLFLLMPITVLGVGGIWQMFKRRKAESILILGTFAFYLVLFAKHHTYSGFTADGRYLMPFLGLWFVTVGVALDSINAYWNDTQRMMALFIVYGLIFLSVRNMMAHIVFSYNYHLDPGLVARRAATPENWSYILRSLFVNWKNMPLLWLVEAIGLAGWWVLIHLRKRSQAGSSTSSHSV